MISIAFTSYNRTELLYEAISPFLQDDRVTEIVISDDCSTPELYQTIVWQYKTIDKVKIFRNQVNHDCYLNKKMAIERCTGEWVAILDSDNVFERTYVDRLETLVKAGLNSRTVYQPEFAKPHFNFRHLSGVSLNKGNIASWIDNGNTGTMLNAFNYFMNRAEYLKVFDHDMNPVTSDSIYHNYRWLNAGNSIYVVPGLEYSHRVHSGSHYQNNVRKTPPMLHEDIMQRLREMK